jgi:hypothetical protein
VTTGEEAAAAFREAAQLSDHFVFIEVIVDKRDAAPASATLRQGFMAHHFSTIPGYKHLKLGVSLAADSSLTAAGGSGGGGGGCASVGGAAAVAGEGVGNGGNRGSTSGMTGVVMAEVGPAVGMHAFAGSSTCLLAQDEGGPGRMSPAAGPASGIGVMGGGVAEAAGDGGHRQKGGSRMGLVPAKRAAEGDLERSG